MNNNNNNPRGAGRKPTRSTNSNGTRSTLSTNSGYELPKRRLDEGEERAFNTAFDKILERWSGNND